MKAIIGENGVLYVKAENSLEVYALDQWCETNIDGCTLQLKHPELRLFNIDTHIPKIRFHKRLWFKFLLFLYR